MSNDGEWKLGTFLKLGLRLKISRQPAWDWVVETEAHGRKVYGFGKSLDSACDDLLESLKKAAA